MELVIELAGRSASICEWRPLAGTSRWLNAIFAPLVARSLPLSDPITLINFHDDCRWSPLYFYVGKEQAGLLFEELYDCRTNMLFGVRLIRRHFNERLESWQHIWDDPQHIESAIRMPLQSGSIYGDNVRAAIRKFDASYRFM